jgi:hypothetical protein
MEQQVIIMVLIQLPIQVAAVVVQEYDNATGGNGGAGGSGIVIARYSGLTQKAYGGTVTDDGTNTIHTFNSSGDFYTGAAISNRWRHNYLDGYYFTHTFTSSGTFTPSSSLLC